MTKEQFYLHTLADHWAESGYPYAADLLRHHANEPVQHQIRDLAQPADELARRLPAGGGPVVWANAMLHNDRWGRLSLYHHEPGVGVRAVAKMQFPHAQMGGVLSGLAAEGHVGADDDKLQHTGWAQHIRSKGFPSQDDGPLQLNTARPEAPEQDYRPNEMLPEDFYGYSRKRKYAAEGLTKEQFYLHTLADHWQESGFPFAADLLRHHANEGVHGFRDVPTPSTMITKRMPKAGGLAIAGGVDLGHGDGTSKLTFYHVDPGGFGGGNFGRRLGSVSMPTRDAAAALHRLHAEGHPEAMADFQFLTRGQSQRFVDEAIANPPKLNTARPHAEEVESPPTPEDFLAYSRARLARAKARHDGRKAARKLARQIGVRKYANEHTPGFADWFAGSKVVGSDGRPLRVYHGTQRGDRIGTALVKGRATSGPMPFFTDDPEIASSYATGKADTSLESPPYEDQFTIKVPGQRRPVPLVRAWHLLPAADRQRIASLAPRVGMGDDSEPTLHPPGHASGSGGYDYHIREARGNHLAALVEEWLNSGNLFNEEHRFPDVLQLAGLSHPVQYHDPHAVRSSVLPAYLSMRNPLDTTAVPPAVVSALARAAGRQRSPRQNGADFWDKNTRDAREWARQLADDVSAGANSHVWTSIPDWVTRTLRGLGYDGIKDTGGKQGGQGHTVYIPFHPSQVKSAIANRGSFDPRARKLTMARPYRAPAGGTVVRGVFYEGGSLLPDLAGPFATGQTPSKPAPPPKSRKINWAAALRRWTGRQRNR